MTRACARPRQADAHVRSFLVWSRMPIVVTRRRAHLPLRPALLRPCDPRSSPCRNAREASSAPSPFSSRSTIRGRVHNSRRHEHARRASGARGPAVSRPAADSSPASRPRLSPRCSIRSTGGSTRGGIDAHAAGRVRAARSAFGRRVPKRSRRHRAAGWRWSGSRRPARSAGTRRGRWANGRAPIRSRSSSCFRPTPSRSATSAAPKGRSAGSMRSPTGSATTRRARPEANIAAHYDLGNDFYSAWLDETMTYSSARFAGGDESLEDAQRRKIARAARPAGSRGPAIACSRSAAAGAARHRGGEARRLGRRPHAFHRAEGLGRAEDRRGRALRPDRNPPPGLSRDGRAIRRRRLGRDGRGGRASAGGAPISTASPAT